MSPDPCIHLTTSFYAPTFSVRKNQDWNPGRCAVRSRLFSWPCPWQSSGSFLRPCPPAGQTGPVSLGPPSWPEPHEISSYASGFSLACCTRRRFLLDRLHSFLFSHQIRVCLPGSAFATDKTFDSASCPCLHRYPWPGSTGKIGTLPPSINLAELAWSKSRLGCLVLNVLLCGCAERFTFFSLFCHFSLGLHGTLRLPSH